MLNQHQHEKRWFVLANASVAQIVENEEAGSYKVIEILEHPNSKKKRGELLTDRAGRYQGTAYPETAFPAHSDPKQIEAEKFAIELIHLLKKSLDEDSFDELIFVAPGHFQHLIKQHAHQSLLNKINQFIDKDYTKLKIKQREKYLTELLKSS